LVTQPVAVGTIEPSITRYRVELSRSDGLPFASQSVRFTGYTGLRPRITDEQYHALLASETPLAAILFTLRAPQPYLRSHRQRVQHRCMALPSISGPRPW